MNPLRLAFGLLTAVPVGRLPSVDRASAGKAVLFAPLTTVPVLALVACAHAAVGAGVSALLAAALVVTGGALLSRALHLDGLADTADGLSAGYDAATSLRAMKASDTGPSGVAAVVLALLLQMAALAALLGSAGGTALAALGWLVSRHSLAWACRRGVPSAQATGLGALVAGSVGWPGLAASGTLLALVAAAVEPLFGEASLGASPWRGLAAPAAGLLAAAALRHRCVRRLGGVTGDVLGACVEVSLTASLVTAAVLIAV